MKKILIIDDNPDFYEPISELLEDECYSVDVISESDDAIDKLSQFANYSLIILDMMFIKGNKIDLGTLPEVGIYIYKKIREQQPNTPIIVASALRKEQIWSYFQDDHKIDYQSKPVISNYNTFLTKIEKLL